MRLTPCRASKMKVTPFWASHSRTSRRTYYRPYPSVRSPPTTSLVLGVVGGSRHFCRVSFGEFSITLAYYWPNLMRTPLRLCVRCVYSSLKWSKTPQTAVSVKLWRPMCRPMVRLRNSASMNFLTPLLGRKFYPSSQT
nr:MAG: RNA-dependent RNA polymerase [Riboviria sp.]